MSLPGSAGKPPKSNVLTQSRSWKDSLFSSARERRLWRWTFLLILGIYVTLPFASSLAARLYSEGLAAFTFTVCLLLFLVTLFALGFRLRPRGVEIGVWLGVAVSYTLVLLRFSLPERSHLIEYGVVAALAQEAMWERAAQRGRTLFPPLLLAILFTSLVGTIDELIQYVLPNRHFEWTDVAFNVLASIMATVTITLLRWVRANFGGTVR